MRTEEVKSSTCANSNDVIAGGRKTESITEDAVIVTVKGDDAILFSDEATADDVPSLDSESEDEETEDEWDSEDDDDDDEEGETMKH